MNHRTPGGLEVPQGARALWYSLGWICVVLLALMVFTGVLMSTRYLASTAPAQSEAGTPIGVGMVRHGQPSIRWLGRTYAPGDLIALPAETKGDTLVLTPQLRRSIAALRVPGTGRLLRPSGAWVSVEQTIARDADLGWLLRAVHRIASRLLVAALFLHLCASLAMGAYDRQRRWTWLGGVGLLVLALTSAFTGYVLPWSQLSHVAARIAAGIAGNGIPLIGRDAAELLRGGRDVGAATLGRFASLHMTLLPLMLVGIVTWHLVLVGRHGLSGSSAGSAPRRETGPMLIAGGVALIAAALASVAPFVPGRFSAEGPVFLVTIVLLSSSMASLAGIATARPSASARRLRDHIYQDLLAALLVFGALMTIAMIAPRAPVSTSSLPVDLTAPLTTPASVRPEWYFAFIYELITLLPEKVALTVLLVGLVVLGGLPWHDRLGLSKRTAGAIGTVLIAALIALTWLGMR